MNNIYKQHEDEIRAIGMSRGADWHVAMAMWESEHTDILPKCTGEEREQAKRDFLHSVGAYGQDHHCHHQ